MVETWDNSMSWSTHELDSFAHQSRYQQESTREIRTNSRTLLRATSHNRNAHTHVFLPLNPILSGVEDPQKV